MLKIWRERWEQWGPQQRRMALIAGAVAAVWLLGPFALLLTPVLWSQFKKLREQPDGKRAPVGVHREPAPSPRRRSKPATAPLKAPPRGPATAELTSQVPRPQTAPLPEAAPRDRGSAPLFDRPAATPFATSSMRLGDFSSRTEGFDEVLAMLRAEPEAPESRDPRR